MQLTNNTDNNYTIRQLKLPLEIEKIIDIADPVYTFCEVMDHIDLTPYFVDDKDCKTGRPRCDAQKLLKVILFSFMEYGICSLREIEKLCRNDIRFMYLLDGMKAPSFATFGNFIRKELTASIEQIFKDINAYIFAAEQVDLQHTYIDGTKLEANANRYSWVWKKSCIKNRRKLFEKLTALIDAMNTEVLEYLGIKFEKREEYAIEYLEELLEKYSLVTNLDTSRFVSGRGHRKTLHQKQYQEMEGYLENYLYCEEHGMEKYMKFTMFEKETKNEKYRSNPYRAVNFKRDEKGNMICPNGRKFIFKCSRAVKGNRYGRSEELYECESCEGCPYKAECCRSAKGNRTVRINRELTSFHGEVISNLESIHGTLLCMNRSIQSEGTFGIIKWNRSYKRFFRRGKENVILEFTLISCGYNLYKNHNRKNRQLLAA